MKVIIFIALKMAEITGLGIIYWILSQLGKIYISFLGVEYDSSPIWLQNILIGTTVTVLIVAMAIGLFYSVRWLIRKNWDLAKKISKGK